MRGIKSEHPHLCPLPSRERKSDTGSDLIFENRFLSTTIEPPKYLSGHLKPFLQAHSIFYKVYLIPSVLIIRKKYFSCRPSALAAAARLPFDCANACITNMRRVDSIASR
jgi:hypothetical protein